MDGDGGGGDVVVVGRAKIDTRAPFRSVKEAVILFGEKVLTEELYAGRRLTEVEYLKFVEIEKRPQSPPQSELTSSNATVNVTAGELQKKRYVTFADPPAPLPDVVMELQQRAPAAPRCGEVRLQRQMSAGHEAAEEGKKRRKKKPLIPLVGALFTRRKKQSSTSF